jgi:hypothetical protein
MISYHKAFTIRINKKVSTSYMYEKRLKLGSFFGGGLGSATPCASPLPWPSSFLIILFLSTTLLTRMTSISLHKQWPLTSQSHGSFSQKSYLIFLFFMYANELAKVGLCQLRNREPGSEAGS